MRNRWPRSRLPIATWLRNYSRNWLVADLTAGLITAVLLIPQGMAYASLAGLPLEVGLYASILPPLVYAILGTSRTLSVGPVSVAALLVANGLATAGANPGDTAYLQDALLLAALSGAILLLMAALRLDVLVSFISHSVLSGFTRGAAVLIILSQVKNLTGITVPQNGSGIDTMVAAAGQATSAHLLTVALGVASIALLLAMKMPLVRLLQKAGLEENKAGLVSRSGPLAVIALLTLTVVALGLDERGVEIVGDIPAGFPAFTVDFVRPDRVMALLPPAIMISLIGYIESVSVAKVLAHRRREKIDNNQELMALGASNLAAALSGAMPVAGGFSRSMVNFSAGAQTQLAAVITAVLVGVATAFFTPLFYYLPKPALAGIIVVAVVPLLDWRAARKAYHYDRADGVVLMATFLGVLVFDIEIGLSAGVMLGVAIFMWRSSRPHIAIVGRIAGTREYRNIERHDVQTWPELLLIRIDRSLYFANIVYIEDAIAEAVRGHHSIQHLIILCSGVNEIDHSAFESLEQLAHDLSEAGVTLHLSDVKGPVMDRLGRAGFPARIAPGQVFMSAEEAVVALTDGQAEGTFPAQRGKPLCG